MSFTGNKPIYALAASLATAVIVLGIIGASAIGELKTSRDSVSNDSSLELKELSHEISQLRNSMTTAGSQPFSIYQNEKTITVTGTASSMIEPDQIYVTLGVDTKADTAQEAARLNAEKMVVVVEAIRDLGIKEDEIRTSYYSLNAVYDYKRNEPPVLIGFTATNTVTVSTPASNMTAGKIIDTAVGADASRIDSALFSVSPELSAKLWEGAVDNAIGDARLKADKILDPMGLKIVGVRSINPFDTGYPIYPGIQLGGVQAPLSPPPTPIYPGQHQFSVSVSVTFLIA